MIVAGTGRAFKHEKQKLVPSHKVNDSRELDIGAANIYALGYMKKIEAVIFDWGGVLIDNPAPGLMRYCAKALGTDEVKYTKAFNICLEDFQTGRISEQQFWKNMTNHLNVAMPKAASLWGEALQAVYTPRPELFALVGELRKAGCKAAILSNTEKPAIELFGRQIYDVFDVKVFSCIEGLQKPDRAIYELMLERLGMPAEQTLFIDDVQGNIDGARQIGLKTILFRDIGQLKKELADFGLNVL